MPTLSSRPAPPEEEDVVEYTVDEVVDMIADAVSYCQPGDHAELKLILTATCRTLWNAGVIADFFIYDSPSGGLDVGFKLYNDLTYTVVQIN